MLIILYGDYIRQYPDTRGVIKETLLNNLSKGTEQRF